MRTVGKPVFRKLRHHYQQRELLESAKCARIVAAAAELAQSQHLGDAHTENQYDSEATTDLIIDLPEQEQTISKQARQSKGTGATCAKKAKDVEEEEDKRNEESLNSGRGEAEGNIEEISEGIGDKCAMLQWGSSPSVSPVAGAAAAAVAATTTATMPPATSNQTKSNHNNNNSLPSGKALEQPSNNHHNQAHNKQSSKSMDPQQMHVCRLCDKLLSSSSSLDRHMLTHSGERPFICKRCHMTFTTNGNMHRHMRTHLHKDSLARQQQEQQLKSLIGASISAASSPAAVAAAVAAATTTTTTNIGNKNAPQQQQLQQQQQQLLHNNANIYNHHQLSSVAAALAADPATSGAVAAAAAAAAAAINSSSRFATHPGIVNPDIIESVAGKQQQSPVTALLNQHLVAALKRQPTRGRGTQPQQQEVSSSAACIRGASGLEPAQGISSPASPISSISSTSSIGGDQNQKHHHHHQTPLPLMAAKSSAAKLMRHQLQQQQQQQTHHSQLDPKTLMMGALQGDQIGLESVKAVMLAAAAAAAAAASVSVQQPGNNNNNLLLDDHQFSANMTAAFGGELSGLSESGRQNDGDDDDDDDDNNVGGNFGDEEQARATGTVEGDEESRGSSSTLRLREKRGRKQVNPRSTRAQQVAASLNSGGDDEDSEQEIELGSHTSEAYPSSRQLKRRLEEDNNERSNSNNSGSKLENGDDDLTMLDNQAYASRSVRSASTDFMEIGINDNDEGDDISEDERNDVKDGSSNNSINSSNSSSSSSSNNNNNNNNDQRSTGKALIKREAGDFNNNNNHQSDEEQVERSMKRRANKSSGSSSGGGSASGEENLSSRMNLSSSATVMSDNDDDDENDDDSNSSSSSTSRKKLNTTNQSSQRTLESIKSNFCNALQTSTPNAGKQQQLEAVTGPTSNNSNKNLLATNLHNQRNQIQQQQQQQNTVTTNLPHPMTTVNGEIIEDISQSYVKTANPNAARKGGKRNRHCYKCKLCTYSSVDRCTLVRHLRIHSGERPYICGICRYAFTTKANCERHVRKRHKKQYNSLGGAGGGGVKGSNGGGRSLIITDHSNHQTIPVKVNPVAAQTISQTLQRIQEKQQNSTADGSGVHNVAGGEDDEDNSSIVDRIPNCHHNQLIRHEASLSRISHSTTAPRTDCTNKTTTTNLAATGASAGFKGSKRKHREHEEAALDYQGAAPYQSRRLIEKHDDLFGSPSLRSREDIEITQNSATNLIFDNNNLHHTQSSSRFAPNAPPGEIPPTNELLANLMAQLQQVTTGGSQQQRLQTHNSSAISSPMGMLHSMPSGPHDASTAFLANMLVASKTIGAAAAAAAATATDDQQPQQQFGSAQQRSLLSSKHLSQQIAQLRNLNSQNSFFMKRNPFDHFNPLDLAAQALDLSCKFQSK